MKLFLYFNTVYKVSEYHYKKLSELQNQEDYIVGHYGSHFINDDKFRDYVSENEHKFTKIGDLDIRFT